MTKKLKAIILAMLTTIATSPAIADMSAVSGPYMAVMGAVQGVELDGTACNKGSSGSDGCEITAGSLGRVFGIAGGEIGWVVGLGDKFGIGIGGTYLAGDASIEGDPGAGDADPTEQIAVDIKNHWTVFVQPMISISDNSALYIKYGHTEADLEITGDVKDTVNELQGRTYALGTRAATSAGGLFMQMEAGAVDYDQLNIYRSSTADTATADPLVAYGSLTLGYKF